MVVELRHAMSQATSISALSVSALSLTVLLGLTACKAVGPDYETPTMNLPTSFSKSGVNWNRTSPDSLPKPREWWKLYKDRTLNSLVERALRENQEIVAADARMRQARNISLATRGLYFPVIDVGASASRSKSVFGGGTTILQNIYSVPLDLSYEIDLWGKVRRQVEGAEASEQVSEETLNAMRLTIASEVAQNYFALRAVDADRAVLDQTLELRRRALGLLTEQRDAGAISGLDLSLAQTQVSTAEAERIGLDQDRVKLVNALAVLTGAAATGSSIPENPKLPDPPNVPGTVPSELLLQRPDIRAAERRVAVANADIGVATAAYYPSVRLGASGGVQSNTFSQLFKSDALVWSIGPNVSLPLTDQVFLRYRKDAAVNAHEAATADYRQIVLDSMREVEDALQGSSILIRQQKAQQDALNSARQAYDLSSKRFDAGLVSFLDVVDTERTRLDAERGYNAVRAQRLAISVSLIKALGGEW